MESLIKKNLALLLGVFPFASQYCFCWCRVDRLPDRNRLVDQSSYRCLGD